MGKTTYNEPHFRAVFNEGIQCAIIKKRNFRLVKSAFGDTEVHLRSSVTELNEY